MIVKHQNRDYISIGSKMFSVSWLVESIFFSTGISNMDLAIFEKPLIMGHRGFQARYPENTMVSFLAAVEAGAQFVELDVTLTRDNQVAVMHDDTVDRTTDGRGRVSDYDLDALQKLDAGGWFHPRFRGERIPSLDEVLEIVAPRAHINIEIKSHELTDCALTGQVEQGVIDLVLARGVEKRVLISSFDPGVLKRIQQLDQGIKVALISKLSPFDETVAQCLELGAFSYHPHLDYIDRELVGVLHKADVYVFPWNINDAGDIRHAFSMGVDGLIAKDPLLVRQCSSNDHH